MRSAIIAHRANLYGPNPNTENTIEAIHDCIKHDIDMELDIWYKNGKFYLGHDEPRLEFDPFTYNFEKVYVWFHCKTIETLDKLLTEQFYYSQNYNNQYAVFFHDKDATTLTSKNDFWTYPGKELFKKSISVMPEYVSKDYAAYTKKLFLENNIRGVCTDYALEWVELKNSKKENKYE